MLDVLVPFDFFCVRRSGEGSLATEKIHVQCLRQKTLDIEKIRNFRSRVPGSKSDPACMRFHIGSLWLISLCGSAA
jgi:hypothetical protein